MPRKETAIAYAKWVLPDAFNWLAYLAIVIITFGLSNFSDISDVFKYADLKNGFLDKTSGYLDKFLPENLSADLSVFVFWTLIGLIVYGLMSMTSALSRDLKDDLDVAKYVYPKGADRYGRIKNFILINAERVLGIVILILCLNAIFYHLLPGWSEAYRTIVQEWPPDQDLALKLLSVILVEFLALHVLVIILRLVLIRKRVLGL